MISLPLARALRTAGLGWNPASGDRFTLDQAETVGEVFTVSEMTIEAHRYASGTILGFNGTTEWALDSVALEDALWLPREDQLRELLRGAFRSLRRTEAGLEVDIDFRGETQTHCAQTAADAYAEALITLIAAADR
ncbi:MAG: pilus assembly protein CpaE [Naasia sp.]|nr:pilus assembly protein CpaE [Naasia sp.]